MGFKNKIKIWLHTKLKNIIEFEKLPVLILNTEAILVGKDSYHNGKFEIRGAGKIKIGSFCAFGRDIKLITSNHNYNFPAMQYGFYRKYFNQKPKGIDATKDYSIEIGNDVWIGDNVCILSNVIIGTGAVIGTGSIVTKNVADYTIVAGVPAKFIRNRFSNEVKEEFLKSEWWNWSDEKIQENKDFFFKNYNLNG